MQKQKILFICGSLNQTTMMHKISGHLKEYECYFTPYYSDGFTKFLSDHNFLDFSILGGKFRRSTLEYIAENNLMLDYGGSDRIYDLVFTCSDLIIPKNIKNRKIILVQEGMTDPENIIYFLAKNLKLPRYLASTSTTGLSDAYAKFCVASEGYRDLFIAKGVKRSKIEVTGIPNFDNCSSYYKNNFPYKNFVLAATSDARETFKYENRKKFILNAVEVAAGRQLIFKLHPNENVERSSAEINKFAPGALVFSDLKIEPMIANCDALVTKYSSVVYIGLALGKEVYSDFDIEVLKKLVPLQNRGLSALFIAHVAKELLDEPVKNYSKTGAAAEGFFKLKPSSKKSKIVSFAKNGGSN